MFLNCHTQIVSFTCHILNTKKLICNSFSHKWDFFLLHKILGYHLFYRNRIWKGVANDVEEVLQDRFPLFFVTVGEVSGLRNLTILKLLLLRSNRDYDRKLRERLMIVLFLWSKIRTREVNQFQLRCSVEVCIARLINSGRHTPIFSKLSLRHRLGEWMFFTLALKISSSQSSSIAKISLNQSLSCQGISEMYGPQISWV